MAKRNSESEATISSEVNPENKSEATSNSVKLPKVLLTRLNDEMISSLKKQSLSKSVTNKQKKTGDKSKDVLKISKKTNINPTLPRPRGRPKKFDDGFVQARLKKNLKSGPKNKELKLNKKIKEKINLKKSVIKDVKMAKNIESKKSNEKLQGRSGVLLKKSILQKRSKVSIPAMKKAETTPTKAVTTKSPSSTKPAPPKPKLEVMQSKLEDNSSDTSGDEFLYDELMEELENTAKKRTNEAKPVPEKTTITLKTNVGNKPPTVLKGGIVKRTDLPSDLNMIAGSAIVSNGLQKNKTQVASTPRGRKKKLPIDDPSPAKKPSPWPVSLSSSPKKSQITNANKKKSVITEKRYSEVFEKQQMRSPKNSPPLFSPSVVVPSEPTYKPQPITLETSKPKIGPKQTAKVVPLSKSNDIEDNLSDEYLEEETLESEMDAVQISKNYKAQTKTESKNLNMQVEPPKDQSPDLELLKILTDESEDNTMVKTTELKEAMNESKTAPTKSSSSCETPNTNISSEVASEETVEEVVDKENEEPPVRTIYDVMNGVFLNYPSWNLHIIPETSAFCIAQVTKGRLGLPTLKKCIELDPVSYDAKVYIHQYHIKRFDGVYDDEESILALIKEIDSIKA